MGGGTRQCAALMSRAPLGVAALLLLLGTAGSAAAGASAVPSGTAATPLPSSAPLQAYLSSNLSYAQFGTPRSVAFHTSVVDTAGVAVISYGWNFGDGNISNGSASTDHLFTLPGAYLVTVEVEDADQHTAISTLSIDILNTTFFGAEDLPGAIPPIASPNATVDFEPPVTFDANASFDWSFGDGSTSHLAAPTHAFLPGTYDVRLTIGSVGGGPNGSTAESSTDVVTVIVPGPGSGPVLAANSSIEVVPVCGAGNLTVLFTPYEEGGVAPFGETWDFGDGTSPGGPYAVLEAFTAPAPTVAELSLVDAAGNFASTGVPVIPYPVITAGPSCPAPSPSEVTGLTGPWSAVLLVGGAGSATVGAALLVQAVRLSRRPGSGRP